MDKKMKKALKFMEENSVYGIGVSEDNKELFFESAEREAKIILFTRHNYQAGIICDLLNKGVVYCNCQSSKLIDKSLLKDLGVDLQEDADGILEIINYFRAQKFLYINIRDMFKGWMYDLQLQKGIQNLQPLIDNDLLFKKSIITSEKKKYGSVIEAKEENKDGEV